MKKYLFILFLVVTILTCPGRDRHVVAIENGFARIAENHVGGLGALLTPLFIKLFEYRIDVSNYMFFSIGTFDDKVLTFGIFGNVFFLKDIPEISEEDFNKLEI